MLAQMEYQFPHIINPDLINKMYNNRENFSPQLSQSLS